MARKTPEGKFNEQLDKELKARFPGCEILKLDPSVNYQGIPDKLVLYNGGFGILETKRGSKAEKQPNQDHHVKRLGKVGFSSFIHPDNMDEVLDALQHTLSTRG